MPHRVIKPVSALLTGSFAVISLGLVLLGWRLAQGPIVLPKVETYIAAALSEGRDDLSISIKEVVVAWNTQELSLDAQMHDVVVTDQEGEAIRIPQANIGLSGRALLNGMIAPVRVTVSNLIVTLVIYEDGRFALSGTVVQELPEDAVVPEERAPLSPMLLALLSPPDRKTALGYLEEVELRSSLLLVENRQTGSNWALNSSELLVIRDDEGAHSLASGQVSRLNSAGIAGDPTPVEWSSRFERKTGKLDLSLSFDNLSLGDLVAQFTGVDFMSGSDAPVTGRVSGELLLDPKTGARISNLDKGLSFAFDLGAGQILAGGGLFAAPFDIYQGRIAGSISPDSRRLDVSQLLLSRAPFVIEGSAAIISHADPTESGLPNPADWQIDAALSLEGLTVQQLKQLWPARKTDGGRNWVVANMDDGLINNGRFRLSIPAGFLGSGERLPKGAIDLTFDLERGVAHLLRPLPPLTNAIGRGHLTANSFTIGNIGGDIAGLTLTDGRFAINDFSVKGAPAEIALSLGGDLPTMLHFLNNKPFGYPAQAGLDPDDFGGSAVAHAQISIPLIKDLAFSDVSLDIKGQVRDGIMPEFVKGMQFTEAAIDVSVTEKGLSATGPLKVNNVPVTAKWTETFQSVEGEESGTHVIVSGNTNAQHRAQLGYDLLPHVTGQVPITADVKLIRGQGTRLTLLGDFATANVDLPMINWQKPEAVPMAGSLRLFIRNDAPGFAVEQADFLGHGFALQGTASFGNKGEPEALHITTLKAGTGTDLIAQTIKEPDGTATLKIEAQSLDLDQGWLAEGLDLFRPEAATQNDGVASDQNEAADALGQIDWWAGRVLLNGDLIATDMMGRFTPKKAEDETEAFAGTLTANLVPGEGQAGTPLTIVVNPLPNNAQYMRAETKDGGRLLRLLGLVDQARDGDLLIETVVPDLASTDQGAGRLRVKDVRIVELPVLAQLINVSSLAGIGAALQGDGLLFNDITVPFIIADRQVRFADGRAVGPSVGIKARGVIGFDGAMDVDGTLAPAYTLNAAIGRIPVIGEMLVGGEGEGLFAANFAIDSDADGKPPKVTVNPLSALTPGFLRGIFGDSNPATNPTASSGAEPKSLEEMPPLNAEELGGPQTSAPRPAAPTP